jgi:methyl-accepting chemotaxis protein
MKSKYSLQRTMIVYFLLIGFASLFVGVEFIMDTHGTDLKQELLSNFEKYANHEISADELFTPIEKLRDKAILMIGIILFVMIIVLTMFIKNITEPLQHMIEISKEISKGDLSQTVRIHSNNELRELGNVINEMSSNLQEITILSRNMCESGNDVVDKTTAILENQPLGTEEIQKIGGEIAHLRKELDMLTQVIEYFNFYTIEKITEEDHDHHQ